MNEAAKTQLGGRAAIAWLIASIYLFATRDPGLISWQAPVFVIFGMFFSAIVVGGLLYIFQSGLITLLSQKTTTTLNEPDLPTNIKAIGLAWIGSSFAICFLVTLTFFNLLF